MKISLSDLSKAEDVLADLPDEFREDVAVIIDTYGDLDHNSLLETVYEKYPGLCQKEPLARGGEKRNENKERLRCYEQRKAS